MLLRAPATPRTGAPRLPERSPCALRGTHKLHSRRSRLLECRSEPSSAPGVTTSSTNADSTTTSGSGSSSSSSKEAMLARIAAAKAYKQTKAGAPGAASPAAAPSTPSTLPRAPGSPDSSSSSDITPQPSPSSSSSNSTRLPPPPQPGAYSAFLAEIAATNPNDVPGAGSKPERGPPARSDFLTNPDAPPVMDLLKSAPLRAGGGSADQAADFLQGVLNSAAPALDPSLRPEEATQLKEERQRALGVDIITVDPSYTPEGASAERYQPKVTTWGVFPRPNNISEAYGGGRTIRPGEELETAEQKKKRQAEYAAALLKFKKKSGVAEVSEADMAAAKVAFNTGMRLVKGGNIREALVEFNKARDLVPLRSKLGGEATLQAAVCYDTLGAAKDAQALYKRIQGHPTSEVSRKARHLVYGFEAMDFLKARSISYAVDKKAYDPYFRRFADASRLYVASEEERAADAAAAQRAALVSVVVILAPLALLAACVGARGL